MDTLRVGLGALLLAISSAVLLATGTIAANTTMLFLASLAALGMAAGSLLIGTSGEGRPV